MYWQFRFGISLIDLNAFQVSIILLYLGFGNVMRTSLSNLFNSVRNLKFSSKFSTFKLYILSFLVVEFVSVSIVLYSV